MPFLSERHAKIAKEVIEVDPELQPQAVDRSLTVEGNLLVAYAFRNRYGVLSLIGLIDRSNPLQSVWRD